MRDDDAPWLAEAPPLALPPRRRPVLNIAIAVLAFGAIAAVGLLMLLGRKDGGSAQGYMEAAQAPLIEADAGPYKVVPLDRQGLELEGDGEVIHEAVRGEDVQSQIDLNAVPEEPIGRPRDLLPQADAAPAPVSGAPPAAGQSVPVQVVPVQVVPAQRPAPKPQTPAPAPAAAKPLANIAAALAKPAPGAAVVQIGAFSSEAKAEEEWARVAGRAKLTGKRIEKLTSSAGKTLWRVRGQASDAAAACQTILAARGACEVVKG